MEKIINSKLIWYLEKTMLLLFTVLTCTIHTIKSEIDKALGNKYA